MKFYFPGSPLFSSVSTRRRPTDGPRNWRLGRVDGNTVDSWHGADEQAGVSDVLVLSEEDTSSGPRSGPRSAPGGRSPSTIRTSSTSRSEQQCPTLKITASSAAIRSSRRGEASS